MIGIALQTLRNRWAAFLGTAVALVLGVAQLAAMGLLLAATFHQPDRPPERFAGAPAVVLPSEPGWNPAHHDLGVRSWPAATGLSGDLLRDVAATGPTTVDRTFYAQLRGGSQDQVGHPWPVARYGGYELTDGGPPARDGEIVVPEGQARTGDRVTVMTAAGITDYTVSGTVGAVPYEDAVFFTGDEAARLSPRVDGLVAAGPRDRVRDAVAGGAAVLTGQDRHRADGSAAGDREALDNTVTLVPVMAAVVGVTVVFVVASTFAFAVAQRRREIALLRAVGATPRQVRRLVHGEALLVGALASATGAALGVPGARAVAALLTGLGVSPDWLTVRPSWHWTVCAPLAGACLTGVAVSLAGAVAAARRAGRVRPAEALREAAVDDSLPRSRWIAGIAAAVCAIGWTVRTAVVEPAAILSPTEYVLSLTVPVLAAALLAPLAVAPLARLLTRPLRGLRSPTVMLAAAAALTDRRRVASTAAPVLLTIGLTFSLVAGTDSLTAAREAALQGRVTAPYALAPDGTPGISPEVVERVAAVDGVEVTAPLPTTIWTDDEGRREENDALVVDPAGLRRTMGLDIVAGTLEGPEGPGDDSMVVPASWRLTAGTTVEVRMGDGQVVPLRIAATYRALRGEDVAYLPPRFAGTARYARDGLVRRAYVSFAPGTDTAHAAAAVRGVLGDTGARLLTSGGLAASDGAYARHLTDVRQRSTAALIALFCCVAIVNTLLMATAGRRGDLALLRLSGATPRQAFRFLAAEAVLVTAVGCVLALAATAVNLAALQVAQQRVFGTTALVVPGATVGAAVLAALVLTVAATLLPVRRQLRSPAAHRPGA